MRLSERLIKIIKAAIYDSFGQVDVYLFGSRTDDNKRGGDIDLAVDVDISKDEFKAKKIKFKTYLFKKDFDLKMDLVHFNQANELLLSEIKSSGIKL
ncbi:MAG: nucleotidyltransferase domain-containing protein [Gammaproteobacteria bacterium]|nr:nucleotidyltransferase domain-containing protein [Gammaproteobacteria bacterium]